MTHHYMNLIQISIFHLCKIYMLRLFLFGKHVCQCTMIVFVYIYQMPYQVQE